MHMVILMKWANYTNPQAVSASVHCFGTYIYFVSYFVLFHKTNIGKSPVRVCCQVGAVLQVQYLCLKKHATLWVVSVLYRASQTCMQSSSSTEPPCERGRDNKPGQNLCRNVASTQGHQVLGCSATKKLLVCWVSCSWGFIST